MKKRLLACLLTAVMLVSLFPLPALAAEGDVSYLCCDTNGQNWQTGTKASDEYMAVTADDTAWGEADGQEHWFVASGEVTIGTTTTAQRVTVTGDVHLILVDGCSLTVNGGINVGENQSLTIYGQTNHTGTLIATAIASVSDGDAGIGGAAKSSGGTITINGGTVTAKGSGHPQYCGSAGIGGGGYGAAGTITINGGTVVANGGKGARGIGHGQGNTGEEGSTVTINGGTVTANDGGWGAAGIGGTFTTGKDGNAIIFASSISDKTGKDSWSGIIFDGNNGIVGGDQTLKEDLEITGDQTLTVPKGSSLTVPDNVTLTNNGTLTIDGELNGDVTNNGNVNGSGTANPKIVQSPPEEGEGYEIDYAAKTITIKTGYEVYGLKTGDTVEPGTLIKCCKLGNNLLEASKPAEFTTPALRPAPDVSINYRREVLDVEANFDDCIKYSRNGTDWYYFWYWLEDLGWNGTTADAIYVRLEATDSNYASAPTGLITIPARPAAPTGLVGVMPTAEGTNDGKITGVTADMKYWSENTYTSETCPDGEITGLAPGAYLVWVEYTGQSFASEEVKVVVPDYTETYTLTVSGGTGSGSYAAGADVTIKANVPSGRRFTGWTVNAGGVTVPNTNPASFTMPAQAVTVTANFETIPTPPQPTTYRVTVQIDGSGTASASPTYAAQGTKITLAATAEEGYHFKEWQVISGGVTIDNNSFTMPGGNVTVKAVFEQDVPVHTHAWAAAWSKNTTHHWHDCTAQDCDISYDSQKDGYAAHTPGPAATCTEPQTCTVCGQEVVPALGHSFGEKVPQKDATTTSTGMKAHYLCSRCGNYFDENKNPTTADALTIPKKASGSGGGSYIPPAATYPPTVERPGEGGGAPTVSPSRPERGDTVTVTPKPDSGYEVDTITVIDRNGKPVEVTKKPDGIYTFKQPSGKVNVKVTYRPTDRPWNNPFTDVSEGDWYYEAVRFVQERGLMNGYSDGRFGLNDALSRAQLAQILFNKEGWPGVNYLLTFSDVAGEAWYTEAIRWATSQGIVNGYGNGTFGPNDPITREQLAVMLWRYSGSPAATNKELHFSDESETSGFALEALRWAVENGILNGYGDGRLGPQGQATRAQVAQMLKNFIENQEENT